MKVDISESKISFDFDGTLDDDFNGEDNPQKAEIQSICMDLMRQGKDVCIITKRYGPVEFGESAKVWKLATQLGVKNVYFTDRVLKDQKISQLGIQVHFENSKYESQIIKIKNPETLVIHVESPDWRNLVYRNA